MLGGRWVIADDGDDGGRGAQHPEGGAEHQEPSGAGGRSVEEGVSGGRGESVDP